MRYSWDFRLWCRDTCESFNVNEIVGSQRKLWFVIPQFPGFVIFFIAGIAETHRLPFDLPEAENELVAGYHTEYSGIKFGHVFCRRVSGNNAYFSSYRHAVFRRMARAL